jgi:hypothetical protein
MAAIFGLLVMFLIGGSVMLLFVAIIGAIIKAVMYLFGHR